MYTSANQSKNKTMELDRTVEQSWKLGETTKKKNTEDYLRRGTVAANDGNCVTESTTATTGGPEGADDAGKVLAGVM
jgi:hypothetical protein